MYLAGLHGDTMVYSNWPEITAEEQAAIELTTGTSDTTTDISTSVGTSSSTSSTGVSALMFRMVEKMSDSLASGHETVDISGMEEREVAVISMNNLYPALFQCFGIIICG